MPFDKVHYISTYMVVVYLIILPICGFVLFYLWELMLEMCCDVSPSKATDIAAPTQRTIAIAPILTKLPPDFKFSNYVDHGSESSDQMSNSALSLANAVKLKSLVTKCLPCPRCGQTKRNNQFELLSIIPDTESRQAASLQETTKMEDVANWLYTQEERGSGLIFDRNPMPCSFTESRYPRTWSESDSVQEI